MPSYSIVNWGVAIIVNMKIRLAVQDDCQQVLALLDELGEAVNCAVGEAPGNREAREKGAPIFREIISRKDTMIFVAEENGVLHGVVTLYLLPNIRHGWHRGHIEDFVVGKISRGKGIGTMLMNAVKDYCREHGIRVVKLDSSIQFTCAHKFYEKQGGKFTEKMFRFDI